MTVYLVTYDYYTTYTLGIFSTRDKAEQAIANFRKRKMVLGLHVPTDDDIRVDEIPFDRDLETL